MVEPARLNDRSLLTAALYSPLYIAPRHRNKPNNHIAALMTPRVHVPGHPLPPLLPKKNLPLPCSETDTDGHEDYEKDKHVEKNNVHGDGNQEDGEDKKVDVKLATGGSQIRDHVEAGLQCMIEALTEIFFVAVLPILCDIIFLCCGLDVTKPPRHIGPRYRRNDYEAVRHGKTAQNHIGLGRYGRPTNIRRAPCLDVSSPIHPRLRLQSTTPLPTALAGVAPPSAPLVDAATGHIHLVDVRHYDIHEQSPQSQPFTKATSPQLPAPQIPSSEMQEEEPIKKTSPAEKKQKQGPQPERPRPGPLLARLHASRALSSAKRAAASEKMGSIRTSAAMSVATALTPQQSFGPVGNNNNNDQGLLVQMLATRRAVRSQSRAVAEQSRRRHMGTIPSRGSLLLEFTKADGTPLDELMYPAGGQEQQSDVPVINWLHQHQRQRRRRLQQKQRRRRHGMASGIQSPLEKETEGAGVRSSPKGVERTRTKAAHGQVRTAPHKRKDGLPIEIGESEDENEL